MQELAKEIEQIIIETRSKFEFFTDDETRKKPNPAKWSKIEILGHLIDSGINNLQRFTEIPFMKDEYQFKSYSQDNLVQHNYYNTANLNQIIDLWSLLNRQIAYLIQQIPHESLTKSVVLPNNDEVSLSFLIDDYVIHLKHHLTQIFD